MTPEEMRKAAETVSLFKLKYSDSVGGGFMVSLELIHLFHCSMDSIVLMLALFAELAPQSLLVRVLQTRTLFVLCTHIIICDASIVMLTWDWVKSHAIPTLVTSIFVGRSRKCWVGMLSMVPSVIRARYGPQSASHRPHHPHLVFPILGIAHCPRRTRVGQREIHKDAPIAEFTGCTTAMW
ncbi:hypothetical protein P692DRAFT_20359945 [Suillus brevipes Sb2]|nr:hypothetical protein P692DRAFT_20359945 [Suillus brevipes Sb2]